MSSAVGVNMMAAAAAAPPDVAAAVAAAAAAAAAAESAANPTKRPRFDDDEDELQIEGNSSRLMMNIQQKNANCASSHYSTVLDWVRLICNRLYETRWNKLCGFAPISSSNAF